MVLTSMVLLLFVVVITSSVAWRFPCTDCSGCCCMFCSGHDTPPSFECVTTEVCLESGGQCKHYRTSAFQRSSPSPLAPLTSLPEGELVEQVHLVGGYPEEVAIVYLTSALLDSSVQVRSAAHGNQTTHKGYYQIYSAKELASAGNGWAHGWKGYDDDLFPVPPQKLDTCGAGWTGYTDPNCIYTSAYVHTVFVVGLQPGSKYEYLPSGSNRWRTFQTAPSIGQPISFGLVADLGQTKQSMLTMQHMRAQVDAGDFHAVIFPGDLSYADGYSNAWDSFGRLGEFLWEAVPAANIIGNHEYANEQYINYLHRYPAPRGGTHSGTPLWYSYEAGLAHVVALCAYCESTPDSAQFAWLERDLATVDRSKTPWLVMAEHIPWYTTNGEHQMSEGSRMRSSMEDLIYAAKVDIVFAGHVHAYERTYPVYQEQVICDGPVYITIGDGGNHEGPACPWIPQVPEWSAFREFSFGHGVFSILSPIHATWTWHRNVDGNATAADVVFLQPSSIRCPSTPIVFLS